MPRGIPKVRTPGASVVPDSEGANGTADEGETDMDALVDTAPDLDDGDAGDGAERREEPSVKVTPAQLASMVDAAVEKRMGARLPLPVAAAELPDQSEVDIKTITRPVLSKQGYVVPEKYGEPVDPAIKRI